MKLVVGRPKSCGKGKRGRVKVCCPDVESTPSYIELPKEPVYKGTEDECRNGYSCLERRSCRPNSMKLVVGRPKSCGKGKRGRVKVCCPDVESTPSYIELPKEPVYKEHCGIQGESETSSILPYIWEGKWPWMVSIMVNIRGHEMFTCTGVLIDKLHVITAAHCVDTKPKKYYARIGSMDFLKGDFYNISRILIPEGYKSRMYYDDIAMLTLSREVDIPNFNPACLPTESLGDLEGHGVTLVGWGYMSPFDARYSELRESGPFPVMSSAECEKAMKGVSEGFYTLFPKGINSRILCTSTSAQNEGDECWYSSGSPVMLRKEDRLIVVGISTFGWCGADIPNGYTKVSEYVDWIKQNKE